MSLAQPSIRTLVHAWNQAKRKCRQAERRWCSMKLAVHRHIYQKEKVQKQISSAKTKHYNNHIIDSSATELHSTMNELLGTAKSPTLSTSYSTAELPSMFSFFFSAHPWQARPHSDDPVQFVNDFSQFYACLMSHTLVVSVIDHVCDGLVSSPIVISEPEMNKCFLHVNLHKTPGPMWWGGVETLHQATCLLSFSSCWQICMLFPSHGRLLP